MIEIKLVNVYTHSLVAIVNVSNAGAINLLYSNN